MLHPRQQEETGNTGVLACAEQVPGICCRIGLDQSFASLYWDVATHDGGIHLLLEIHCHTQSCCHAIRVCLYLRIVMCWIVRLHLYVPTVVLITPGWMDSVARVRILVGMLRMKKQGWQRPTHIVAQSVQALRCVRVLPALLALPRVLLIRCDMEA